MSAITIKLIANSVFEVGPPEKANKKEENNKISPSNLLFKKTTKR